MAIPLSFLGQQKRFALELKRKIIKVNLIEILWVLNLSESMSKIDRILKHIKVFIYQRILSEASNIISFIA